MPCSGCSALHGVNPNLKKKKNSKNEYEITKTASYRLQFIDSARFMASSLSNLVNNLAEEIHKIKYKYGCDNKKCETCRIKYKNRKCCREYKNIKNNLVECNNLCRNENYQKAFDENFKKRFANTYNFPNHDISKFFLLLRKGVYPYEYIDDREKFMNHHEEDFYCDLNKEDITDADCKHAKRFCQDLKQKHLGEFHDLYVLSNTLLLSDEYENFQNNCL